MTGLGTARLVLGLVVLLQMLPSAEQLQQARPPAPNPDRQSSVLASGTALILGRVVEAGTTNPVREAIVSLGGEPLGPRTAIFSDGTPGGARIVAADSNGWFVFAGLPKGAYRVAAEAAGFVGGEYGQPRPNQVARSLDLIRTVEVADGERRGDVRIALWRQGAISGVVHDEAGEPLVGITVTVLTRVNLGGGPVMQARASMQTDDRGFYRADVIPGEYVVAVLAAPATLPFAAIDDYLQAQADGLEGLRSYQNALAAAWVALPPPGGGGLRVGDLMLLQAGGRAGLAPGTADPNGRVTMYPTTYYPSAPTAMSAAVVTVGSGEEKSGIDLRLVPRATVRVTGRVIGPDGPVAGLGVRMAITDPAVVRTSPATVIDEMQAMTDRTGAFTFLGVVPGDYTLRAFQRPGPPNERGGRAPGLWAIQRMIIAETDLSNLVVTMKSGASINGRILSAGGKPALERMDDFMVRPTALPGQPAAFFPNINYSTRPDPSAVAHVLFSATPIVPGPYVLSFTGVPSGWVVKSAIAGAVDIIDHPVEIDETGLDGVVVTLTDRVSTISGTARDADGRPAEGATIGIFPVEKSLWRRVGLSSRRTATVAPGRDGRYRLSGLPPGEYFLAAISGEPPDLSDHVTLAKLTSVATRIQLGDGEARVQELRTVVVK